jgi:O-antigen/teichoic acid export membrane protein
MSLRNQSALIFVSSLAQLFFGMLAGVITARFLGPQGKGISILAFFLPAFLGSLGSISMGEASTYLLGRGADPRRIVGNTVWHSLILGLLYAAGTLALLPLLRASVVRDVPAAYVFLGLLALPPVLLKNYGDSVLVGMKRVREFVGGNLLLHATRGLLLTGALAVFDLGLPGAIGAELLTWVAAAAYYLAAMTRGTGIDWRLDWPLTKEQLRYGFQAHVGNMAQRANLQVSTIILSSLSGAAAVGLVSVATNVAQILWYIPDSVGRILFPKVASSSREESNRVTPLVCRNTVFLTLLAAASLLAIGRPVVTLLFGREFEPSVRPLDFLLPGIVALSVSKVLTKYLSGVGRPFLNSTASLVSFLVNVPLLYVMVRAWGLDGAAVATSVAYLIHAVVVVVFFLRESHTRLGPSLVPDPKDLRLYVEGAAELARRLRLHKTGARTSGSKESSTTGRLTA